MQKHQADQYVEQTLSEIETLMSAIYAFEASAPGYSFKPAPPDDDRFTDDESEALPVLIRAAQLRLEAIHAGASL